MGPQIQEFRLLNLLDRRGSYACEAVTMCQAAVTASGMQQIREPLGLPYLRVAAPQAIRARHIVLSDLEKIFSFLKFF